ncbi:MAG TPA: cobalamin biosynthesis protein CbiX [Lentisphaeria bacterium]|nr:cobalamin biosynthesis protein CbiX [Lentisphaeria bacterium]
MTALVIVDHGSKREAANRMLQQMCELVLGQAAGRYMCVRPAHMELAEPTLGQAIDACVADGATTVIISLLFLAPGRHATADIPALVAESATAHPGLEIHLAEPLGLDALLADLLIKRADQARSG